MIVRNSGAKETGPYWFIEMKRFTSSWNSLNLKVEDLLSLQDDIKADPTHYPVISGTNGLRKMRFAPQSPGKGKRGAFRVCYSYLPRFSASVLVLVYPKNEKADLSPADRKVVKSWLIRLEDEFKRRFGN